MAATFTDTNELGWEEVPDAWRGKSAEGEPGVRFKRFQTGSPIVPLAMLVEYEPGHHEREHSHPESEFFFMLEGEMRVLDQSVVPGTLVFLAARSSYSIMTGTAGARFLRLQHAS
ncbi:cupin domain-containing protein [Pseudofrankia inefficax]|uniref:Cupin 2 conserved barrel domain protein n=1 Tax=Pseudofrankia inefficax (strain DSM 45817 / CECT 9037 / DDB 130130 / EuI1c) TaxID=298654 RepID=E3J5Q1_PSEI1|nr:cupin domain-containing protein [Pseudofrankia inefficax]ADP83138.1 Cupin 2 conserved barrel domain protein [Pseudofrankia inefficax]